MLVSVNAERGTVTIYTNAVITVPIAQIGKLRALLANKTVQYVSEVTECAGEDILEMVAEMAGSGYVPTQPAEVCDGRMWFHATGSGQLYLPLGGKKKLQFEGPMDFMSVDQLGYDVLEHPQVKALMERKKLEVVGTAKMNQIKRETAHLQQEREEKMYGSLLMDTRISKDDKRRGKVTIASEGRGELIDMDDYTKKSTSEFDMLPPEMQEMFRKGWGAAEEETGTE